MKPRHLKTPQGLPLPLRRQLGSRLAEVVVGAPAPPGAQQLSPQPQTALSSVALPGGGWEGLGCAPGPPEAMPRAVLSPLPRAGSIWAWLWGPPEGHGHFQGTCPGWQTP